MRKKDIKIKVNKNLWRKMKEKVESEFGEKFCDSDCLLIVLLLAVYKRKNKQRSHDNKYLSCESSTEFDDDNYFQKTISVYAELLDHLQKDTEKVNYSQIIENAIGDYLYLPMNFYTDCISPLYTIVGSKNNTMQKATAEAVDKMNLINDDLTVIDGCCATGALFFGLKTYSWKNIILNDMNPLRTNFLNVIKLKPLTLIKMILDTDLSFIEQPDSKNEKLHIFKNSTTSYETKRRNYKKVDCNVKIAYEMFLLQCIDKAMIERSDKIFERLTRFLPAHLKLKNASITQSDCLTYLNNDNIPKLVLLDVPYIGSEKECAIKDYHYESFHKKVANHLQQAKYPFIYYCRSSAPKHNTTKTHAENLKIMKVKLGLHFFNKNFYFHKVHLKEDTELLISNRNYDMDKQFQWTDFKQDLL